MALSEQRFWELIDSSRLAAAGDVAVQHDLLCKRLSRFSPHNIAGFQERLDGLSRAAATEELLDAVRKLDPDFGADDDFDDLCHWVVSRGRSVYESILANPARLAEYVKRDAHGVNDYCFTLFGNAYGVYEKKTGIPLLVSQPVSEKKPKRRVRKVRTGGRQLQVHWREEFEPTDEHVGTNCIAVDSEHDLVAVGGRNGQVRLWDCQGKAVCQLMVTSPAHRRDDGVRQIVLNAERQRLVAVDCKTLDQHLSVWDLHNHNKLFGLHNDNSWHPPAVASDATLAAIDRSGSIEVWNLETGTLQYALCESRQASTFAASPDLSRIVAVGSPRFKVWNGRTGEELLAFRGNRKNDCIKLSPDASRLLGDDGHAVPAMIWDVNSGKRLPNEGELHRGVFSTDSRLVANSSFSDDYILRVWDLQSTDLLQSIEVDDAPFEYRFAGDNSLLTATSGGEVQQWDAEHGILIAFARIDARAALDGIASVDGSTIFVCDGHSLTCLG